MRTAPAIAALFAVALSAACQSMPGQPIRTVEHVDLERFMGDWYVIANIPTFIERGAYNAVESYRLTDQGTVATTFTFRQGGFDGELKSFRPTGYVREGQGNAVWGMQFVWPIRADYRIVYLDSGYTRTIIGRNQRDYVWIMARSPSISETDYQEMIQLLAQEGYEVDRIQRVPQHWPQHTEGAAGSRAGGWRDG